MTNRMTPQRTFAPTTVRRYSLRMPAQTRKRVAASCVFASLFFAVLGASCSSGASHSAAGGGNGDSALAGMVGSEAGSSDGSGAEMDGASNQDTWENYARNFFATYCTSCHGPQDPTARDYNIQANVAKDRAAMRCGVASTQDPAWNCGPSPVARQFPIGNGPKPSDAERARIVAWIDAGDP